MTGQTVRTQCGPSGIGKLYAEKPLALGEALAGGVDAVRTDEPVERNTVGQALQVQCMMDAIYRSDEQGEAVRLGA